MDKWIRKLAFGKCSRMSVRQVSSCHCLNCSLIEAMCRVVAWYLTGGFCPILNTNGFLKSDRWSVLRLSQLSSVLYSQVGISRRDRYSRLTRWCFQVVLILSRSLAIDGRNVRASAFSVDKLSRQSIRSWTMDSSRLGSTKVKVDKALMFGWHSRQNANNLDGWSNVFAVP